jgi:predicted choloylglycine hydrolase
MTHTDPTKSLSLLTDRQLSELIRDISDVLLQRTAAPAPLARTRRRAPRLSSPNPTEDGERLRSMRLYGIHEETPGVRWQSLFDSTWPAYRAWYLSEGLDKRPDLPSCRAALNRHMPELVPTWERLVVLADRDDLAARMLSLWEPPGFAPGCAQLVLEKPQRLLIRNYDYSPDLFEQVVYSSRFIDRRVIGTGDCLWGLLDGMNDDGLVVSFTFGGRPGAGHGFGISLVVRYLLEVCATVQDARAVLDRLPVSMSYNVTISDRLGATVTAFVAPDSPPEFFDTPLATNHRGIVPEYPEAARALNSVGRQDALMRLVQSAPNVRRATEAFLKKPLHNTAYSRGFGTLYTAVYFPDEQIVQYHWPDTSWHRSFSDPDGTKDVVLKEPVAGSMATSEAPRERSSNDAQARRIGERVGRGAGRESAPSAEGAGDKART